MRHIGAIVAFALISGTTHCWPQGQPSDLPNLNSYFKQYVRLSDDQVRAIRSGKAIAKTLHSRKPAEMFVFGSVYINATPDSYSSFSTDFDRLRKLSGYLAIDKFGSPTQLDDLEGFAFDRDDIDSLKKCWPGDCDIQMPESSMQNIKMINWSAVAAA